MTKAQELIVYFLLVTYNVLLYFRTLQTLEYTLKALALVFFAVFSYAFIKRLKK